MSLKILPVIQFEIDNYLVKMATRKKKDEVMEEISATIWECETCSEQVHVGYYTLGSPNTFCVKHGEEFPYAKVYCSEDVVIDSFRHFFLKSL